MFDWYRAIKWVIGGLVCIGVGIALIVSPDLRANPRELSSSDLAAGCAAIVVGVVMLGLSGLPMWRR